MPASLVNEDCETIPGTQSPLDYAVSERDKDTIAMVQDAVHRQRTFLAYQPVVQSGRPDRPAFYEGLIRIQDPSGRTIPAKDFIGAVETQETGRLIDCLALEMGLAKLAEEPGLRLSINMSARSIGFPRWMKVLKHGLRRDDTIGERLILEITESSAISMPELVRVFMEDLQKRGISFALDDFGAGYTAFRYLRDFYFDIIKIDGQFIRGIAHNPDNQILTKALISIARHFEMFTVAEYVENQEDAEYLLECGIDCMQGYYFGAPSATPLWVTESQRRHAG